MSSNLMSQSVNLWRPIEANLVAQEIVEYTLIYSCLPVAIQPMSSQEAFYYHSRGLENAVTVYTEATRNTYHKNDVLQYFDNNGVEWQFHIEGIMNLLFSNQLVQFSCYTYPEHARKRNNIEQVTQ